MYSLLNLLHLLSNGMVTITVTILNTLGSIILLFSSIQAFGFWMRKIKIEEIALRLGRSFAIGIQVLLAAEILRLITIRDNEDLMLIGAILLLHVVVTLLVRYEVTHHIESIKGNLGN